MFGFWLRIAANTVEPERGSPERKYIFFTGKTFQIINSLYYI
jgi:hypothetical protein